MLCDMFSNEYDSSFAAILRLSKKGGLKTFYSKYLLSFILSTFSYFFFFIIDIAFLFTYYGVDYLNVGIMSIPLFSSTNMDINILGYLVLYKSISYIGILILSSLITSISSITKKLPLSIAINIVILFIPYILSAFEIHTLDNLNIVLILSPMLIHYCFIPIIIFFSISFVLMHISKKIWISNQCNRKKSIPWNVII